MTVIAGIDAGGTKLHARAIDTTTGQVVVDSCVDDLGWAARSDSSRAEELARVAEELFVPVGATVLAAGVHGCDSEQQRALMHTAVARVIATTEIMNDAELVVPAAGYDSGTGVIAGTGSSATSHDASGASFTVGGWGWVLGDEGSASGVVRDAGKAVLGLLDAGSTDPLADALLSALRLEHPHELGYTLSTIAPMVWARHAAVVFEAAAAGSRAAATVIEAQLDGLIGLLDAVDRRGGDLSTVAVAGGVMTGQPAYFRAFSDRAEATFARVDTVALVEVPPVEGALRCARRMMLKEVPA